MPLLRWTLRSLRTGAAGLGLALVLFSDDVLGKVALLFVGMLAVVGTLSRIAHRWSLAVCVLVPAMLIGLARTHAGVRAAVILTILLTLAACLRLGFREVVSGLAALGAGVAVLAGASPRVLLAFGLFGCVAEVLADVRARRRRAANSENAELPVLNPEN